MSWDHAADYPLPSHKEFNASTGGGGFVKTYFLGKEHEFLADHIVDGRILMPVIVGCCQHRPATNIVWRSTLLRCLEPCCNCRPVGYIMCSCFSKRRTLIGMHASA